MISLALTISYLELLKLASPEAIVVISAVVVLAIGLTSRRATVVAGASPSKPPTSVVSTAAVKGWCSLAALLGIAIAIVAVLMLPRNASLFGGMLVITPLSSLFKIICLVLAFFTVCLVQSEKLLHHPGEYLAIILLATVGLMLLVGSEELLMIFIGLELLGLSLYVMAAFDKADVRSAEAGLKYFLFGSTASAFTLFGISLIYGMSGSTGLAAISEKLAAASMQPLLATGIIMTLIGFAFKGCLFCCAWENRARRLWPSSREFSMARNGCRLVASPCRARCFVNSDWKPSRIGTDKCSAASRLLGRCSRWLHVTWTYCRRP